MALTTGTGLTNVSDVIEAVRTHMLNDGWTSVINSGSVGSNNKEVWLTKNAVDTFYNQYPITVGMNVESSDRMELATTYMTPTECLLTPPGSPATRNAFNRVLGTPNTAYGVSNPNPTGNNGDIYPTGWVMDNSTNNAPTHIDGFNQGANYLNHWIFSPNGSPHNINPIYVYCVVEIATGVYRTFGFGEGIKLGASGWTGGLFQDGTDVRAGSSSRSRYFASGHTVYNGFSHEGEDAYILNFNNDNILNGVDSPQTWNPWMHVGGDAWTTDWVQAIGSGTVAPALGWAFASRGTAAFSGQTIRIPARFYGMNVRDGAGANRFRPLIEYPDVFHMHIGSFTPGSVITDDAEKFLVVPYVSKTGTDNSGNNGFLIRHPDL